LTTELRTLCMFWMFNNAPTAPRTSSVLIQPDSRYAVLGSTVTVVDHATSLPCSDAIARHCLPVRPGSATVQLAASLPLHARDVQPTGASPRISSNDPFGSRFGAACG
jgi:hypothetical protein